MADMEGVRTGRHCVFVLHAHLVFVTKYRHKVFGDRHLARMEEVMRMVCADFEVELAEFNGEADHVHLLVNFPPKVALSKLVNSLKASRPAGCARSSPNWPATTTGRTGCGRAPTSPGPSAPMTTPESIPSASDRGPSRQPWSWPLPHYRVCHPPHLQVNNRCDDPVASHRGNGKSKEANTRS